MFEIDRFRLERGVILFRYYEPGITALFFKTEISVYCIAFFESGHLTARLFHYARYVHSRNERETAATETAFADGNVYRINCRSHDPDENFVIFWLRPWCIVIFQHLRSAVLMNNNGLHRRLGRQCHGQRDKNSRPP